MTAITQSIVSANTIYFSEMIYFIGKVSSTSKSKEIFFSVEKEFFDYVRYI